MAEVGLSDRKWMELPIHPVSQMNTVYSPWIIKQFLSVVIIIVVIAAFIKTEFSLFDLKLMGDWHTTQKPWARLQFSGLCLIST